MIWRNIALGSVALVFAGFLYVTHGWLSKEVRYVIETAEAVEAALLAQQPPEAIFAPLDAHWERSSRRWGLLVSHHDLADATKVIKRLGVAVRTGQAEEAAMSVSDLRLIMQQILGRNTLSWEHIF